MTHLSFGTNGSLEKLAADIWVMLYVHPFKFSNIFSLISNVFINIHEYANYISISYYWVKVLCLRFYLVTSLVV